MINNMNAPAPGSSYVVFRVTPCGWAVLDPSRRQVGKANKDRAAVQITCDRLNAELDRKKKRGPRACMCCGATFVSEGIHNRLCDSCRRHDTASSLSIPASSIAQVRRAAKM